MLYRILKRMIERGQTAGMAKEAGYLLRRQQADRKDQRITGPEKDAGGAAL